MGTFEQYVELAIKSAEMHTGRPVRPATQNDTGGVRALACYVLGHTKYGSWADISRHVYGRGRSSKSQTAARRWVGSRKAQSAILTFRQMVSELPQPPVAQRYAGGKSTRTFGRNISVVLDHARPDMPFRVRLGFIDTHGVRMTERQLRTLHRVSGQALEQSERSPHATNVKR